MCVCVCLCCCWSRGGWVGVRGCVSFCNCCEKNSNGINTKIFKNKTTRHCTNPPPTLSRAPTTAAAAADFIMVMQVVVVIQPKVCNRGSEGHPFFCARPCIRYHTSGTCQLGGLTAVLGEYLWHQPITCYFQACTTLHHNIPCRMVCRYRWGID